ncbi:hypothetical protein [Streptomyces sp. NPDC001933]|uniref:hypothetical protein n=1 Tax=Streptomyces sp. NPDC001933 TaxID=3364626 RepID=UPI0036CDEEB2
MRADPDLALYSTDGPAPGVLAFTRVTLDPAAESPQPLREWTDDGLLRRAFCFRAGGTAAHVVAVRAYAQERTGRATRSGGPARSIRTADSTARVNPGATPTRQGPIYTF